MQNIPGTDYEAGDIVRLSADGSVHSGSLSLKSEHGPAQRYTWTANPLAEGRWQIAGEGALTATGKRVPNRQDYPFSMDPIVNQGLRHMISEFLNRPHGGNGNGAVPQSPVNKPAMPTVSASGPELKRQAPVANPEFRIAIVPVSRIRRFAGQPRQYFPPDHIQGLAGTLQAYNQQEYLTVKEITGDPDHDFELVNGECRWRAAAVSGRETMEVKIITVASEDEQHLLSMLLNYQSRRGTFMEQSNALHRQVFTASPRKKVREMAAICQITEGWAYKLLSLQELIPELQALIDPPTPESDRLGVVLAADIAKLASDRQRELLGMISGTKAGRGRNAKITQLLSTTFSTEGVGERKSKPASQARAIRRFVVRLKADTDQAEKVSVEGLSSFVTYHPIEAQVAIQTLREMAPRLLALAESLERAPRVTVCP